jgi:hypothetical protein
MARRRAKDYENWLRAQGQTRQADDYARWVEPRFAGSEEPPVPHDIRAFSATVCGTEVQYRRDADRRLAFIDRGRTIDMTSSREDDATLAALQVAQAKWRKVSIRGSAGFRERAARFAAREGIQVEDADLQALVRDERERMARGEPDPAECARLKGEAERRQATHARQGEREDEQDLGR